MRALIINIILFILFVCSSSYAAESGIIRGTVIDNITGEALPGVTIYVENTQKGTISDLDGKFNLSIEPGNYVLRISFVSYETIVIKDLKVKPGEVTLLGELRIKESSTEIAEVVVSAERIKNTENSLLTIRQISTNLLDGISASNFKKTGDSDAASSIKRVPGVSIAGGRYVYVRGLGDRYTKTILNGVDIPGLDPDRNTLQMDIFPTNVLDNIIVHKSFTADLPADFTGGIIDINVKAFPEQETAALSTSFSYNPGSHFNSNYLTYKGGKTDFLGFDDGTRRIPATSDIPLFSNVVTDPDGSAALRYRQILGGFNPSMAAYRQKSFMDYSLGASYGNQQVFEKFTLGYNVTFSYKNSTDYYENAQYGRYGLSGDPSVTEMDVREFQKGDYGVNSVLLSSMAGLALKTRNSKFRINLLHLQNGESTAGIFDYEGSDQGSIFSGFQHNLEYSQRSLTNLLIHGKHNFIDSKWNIGWKISPTLSRIDDPDIRFTRYVVSDGKFIIGTESGFPERIWRELEERNLFGLMNIAKEFSINGNKSVISFGSLFTYKERDFGIRNFAINVRNVPLTGDPDELFRQENLWPMDGYISRGTTYDAAFVPVNPNQFNASTTNISSYLSAELNLVSGLKTIIGLRFENYVQYYTGQDQLGTNVLDNDRVLNNLDFFPSVNLVYNLSGRQNLRFSFARTIARPSLKELSYSEIYDPISGRTFVGGLFRDADDISNVEYWDGNLVSTFIYNYDLRWEKYYNDGQMISLSGFYKKFNRPIEIVQFATQTSAFQPRNVGDGKVLGTEAEIRQKIIGNLSLTANFTYAWSRIIMSKTEYNSRVENARTGQTISEYRDMAGQAPFLINSGLSYIGNADGFWNGFDAGFYYNVQGRTLQYVGIADHPDIYSKPFHSLNFNSNMNLGRNKRWHVGLKIENLLNSRTETIYKSFKTDDRFFTRLDPGMSFTFRLGYNID